MWVYQEPEIQPIEKGPITPPPSLPHPFRNKNRCPLSSKAHRRQRLHTFQKQKCFPERLPRPTESVLHLIRDACFLRVLISQEPLQREFCRRFWIQQRWTCFPITCAVGAACLLSRALHRLHSCSAPNCLRFWESSAFCCCWGYPPSGLCPSIFLPCCMALEQGY